VEVDLLFGGRSGSLVLTTTSKDLRTERIEQCCVVKVDRESDMKEEVEMMDQIIPFLGENAPRILCGGARWTPILMADGAPITIDMGKRTGMHTIGVLAIELVGAAWVAPEFMQLGGKLMCTLKDLCEWELKKELAAALRKLRSAHDSGEHGGGGGGHAAGHKVMARAPTAGSGVGTERSVFGDVPKVLMDVFGRAGLLTRLASRTAQRSPDGPEWLLRAGPSARVADMRKTWAKDYEWWAPEFGLTQEAALAKFEGVEALRWPDWASGTRGWTPIVSLVHADMHGQNILIDLRETTWIIDFGMVREPDKDTSPIYDLGRLVCSLLFEYNPLEVSNDVARKDWAS
jgi:hypothetical protein